MWSESGTLHGCPVLSSALGASRSYHAMDDDGSGRPFIIVWIFLLPMYTSWRNRASGREQHELAIS